MLLDRIKELCNERGINVATLERNAGLKPATISRWGTNTPSVDKVDKVADYFGVSNDYLMGKTDIRQSIPEILKGTQWAFNDGRFDGLTDEDIEVLADMAQVLMKKREKEGK